MAFCANCGSEVQGRFCAKCGAAVAAPPGGAPEAGGYAGSQAGGPGQAYSAPIPPPPVAQAGLEENMASALCYLLTILTGVLFLVLEPYSRNRTVRFHAFQAIFFGVGAIVTWVVVEIITIALTPIPFLGFMLSLILHLGVGLGLFILWLMLMYKAYNRERWVLPVIGPLAEKQA